MSHRSHHRLSAPPRVAFFNSAFVVKRTVGGFLEFACSRLLGAGVALSFAHARRDP